MASLDVPDSVVQAAAERANQENRSLSEVVTVLMREYADGGSWLNLPVGEG